MAPRLEGPALSVPRPVRLAREARRRLHDRRSTTRRGIDRAMPSSRSHAPAQLQHFRKSRGKLRRRAFVLLGRWAVGWLNFFRARLSARGCADGFGEGFHLPQVGLLLLPTPGFAPRRNPHPPALIHPGKEVPGHLHARAVAALRRSTIAGIEVRAAARPDAAAG